MCYRVCFASVLVLFVLTPALADGPYVNDAVVVCSTAPMKEGDARLGAVPVGQVLTVLQVNGDWLWIRYIDRSGWVHRRHVMLAKPSLEHYSDIVLRGTPTATDWLLRGVSQGMNGLHSAAVADFDRSIELDSDNALAFMCRGDARRMSATSLAQLRAALADYGHALERASESEKPQIYDKRGLAWLAATEPNLALDDFERAIALNPGYDEPFLHRALLQMRGDDDAAVLVSLAKCLELNPRNCSAHLLRGAMLEEAGDAQAAILTYSHVIKLDPRLAAAYNRRGAAYVGLGQYRLAISDLDVAIQLQPASEHFMNRALARRRSGDLRNAIVDLDEAIRLDPSNWLAYNNRAFTYQNLNDYNRAIADYGMCLRLNPQYVQAYNDRGMAWLNKGEVNNALYDFTRLIRLAPDEYRGYWHRAECWLERNELANAEADIDTAIRLNPQDAEVYVVRGRVHKAKGDSDLAIAAYKEAIRINPACASAHSHLGSLYIELEEYANAHDTYQRLIELLPSDPVGYNGLGHVHYSQRKYESAIEIFTKSIALSGNNPYASYAFQLRGRSYRHLGKRDLSSRDYALAYEVAPDDRHACLLRAEDLSEQGMHDEAMEILDVLLESEEAWAVLHNTRGKCLRDQGERDEAIASFDRALELDATLASAWNNRGLTWFNKGDVEKAIADYNRALETGSKADESEYVHCNRGIALAKAGRFAEAIDDFERAIELNPKFPEFHIRFASVLATCPDAALRDEARAREHAQQACELTEWENPGIIEVLANVCRRTGDSEGAAKYTRLMRELREGTQPGRQAEDEGLRSAAP